MDLNEINLPEIYKERLNQELKVIIENGIQNFMPYFITLADIVSFAKKNGMLVGPARGCLLANNLILTKNNNFIPIQNVKKDDVVFTHLGNFKKVTNTFVYNFNDTIIDIETYFNNFNNLQLTFDHKIRIKRDNVISWIPADQVQLTDYLFFPKFNNNNNNVKQIDLKTILPNRVKYRFNSKYVLMGITANQKHPFSLTEMVRKLRGKITEETLRNFKQNTRLAKPKTLFVLHDYAVEHGLSGLEELRETLLSYATKDVEYSRKLILNDDFCFLLGVFNAVGLVILNKNYHRIHFGQSWKEKPNIIYGLIKKIFNIQAWMYKDTKIGYEVGSNHFLLVDVFNYFVKTYGKNKRRLSTIVEQLNEKQLKKFFAGLLFGLMNGKPKGNTFVIREKDDFVLDLHYFFLKLNILHNIEKEKFGTKYKYTFTLFFTPQNNFHTDDLGIWVRPKNINKCKSKTQVYDLEVEDDHSFLTFDGIVHNSAAGSLTAYLLGITSIDPIRWNLPFSRFLSVSRLKKSVPDIDVDFEVNDNDSKLHRDNINKYIFEKYGDKAAQIATFGMLKLRNSLQDSFRIHISQPTENKIYNLQHEGKKEEAEALSSWLKNERLTFDTIRKSFGKNPIGVSDLDWLQGYKQDDIFYPGLIETNVEFKKWAIKYPEVIDTAKLLLGIPRNIGKHAAGIVIADRSIPEICGVMKIDGHNVISYNKKDVAKLGLIKNDNLGLTCLNFIGDTLRLLAKENIILDPWELPEDGAVFETFLDGKCLTIFQHETMGGASFIKKLVPQCKEDLFASVALNRPGALDAMIKLDDGTELSAADVYLERRAGRLPLKYLHDDLEPILKNTFGVYVYQEQVMASMQLLLGYSEEESDSIRSAISDKNHQAFDEVKKRLPMLKNKGWSDNQISEFFQQIIAFSGYSFNKSHSCAYGLIAYTTAYLKYYYPMQWWASVLSHSTPDDVMEKYWIEVNSFVIEPNINNSQNSYVIKDKKLIPPLNLIKGIGESALKELSLKSPFVDFKDFMTRIEKRIVNKGVVISLLKAGAMNCLFEKNLSLSDKIKTYFELKAEFEKKKKTELEEHHLNLTPYDEYLLAKSVLPISNIPISESIFNTPNINKPFIDVTYYTSEHKELNISALRGSLPLVSGKVFNHVLKNIYTFKDSYLDVCCYGYVTAMRKFPYFSKQFQIQKQAIELNLDFDNFFYKIVCWPNKKEKSPALEAFVEEKKVFLFKIRIDKNRENFSIIGLEEITKKH